MTSYAVAIQMIRRSIVDVLSSSEALLESRYALLERSGLHPFLASLELHAQATEL